MNTTPRPTDTLNVVMDVNDAMREELEALMVSKYGSVNAYFKETGDDKRNFYTVLGRSPQMKWILARLANLDVSLGVFFDAVEVRQQGSK